MNEMQRYRPQALLYYIAGHNSQDSEIRYLIKIIKKKTKSCIKVCKCSPT